MVFLLLALVILAGQAGMPVRAETGAPVEPGAAARDIENPDPDAHSGGDGGTVEAEPEPKFEPELEPEPEPEPEPAPRLADEPDERENEAGTVARFVELLNNPEVTEIVLTADLVFTDSLSTPTMSPDNVCEIVMGEYGITVQEGLTVRLNRWDLRLVGEGVRAPLVTQRPGSQFGVLGTVIEATGDGAVAFYNDGGEGIYRSTTIIADGAGATALRDTGSDDIPAVEDRGVFVYGWYRLPSFMRLYARGEGGTAIDIDGNLYLHRAVVSGDLRIGGDALIVCSDVEGGISAGGGVELDSSYADPAPADALVVTRRATWQDEESWYNLEQFGYSLAPGQELVLPEVLHISLWRPDQDFSYFLDEIEVTWGEIYADATDPDLSWAEAMPVEIPRYMSALERLTLPIKVPIRRYDPDQPHLTYAYADDSFRILGWPQSIEIGFSRSHADAEEIILWVSEDRGKTWASHSSHEPKISQGFLLSYTEAGVSISNRSIEIYDWSLEAPYLFQIEVVGGAAAGRSNVLSYWHTIRATVDPMAGERDGDGWEETEPPDGKEPTGEGQTPAVVGTSANSGNAAPGQGADASWSNSQSADQGGGQAAHPADNPAASGGDDPDPASVQAAAAMARQTVAYPEGALTYLPSELRALGLANPQQITFLSGSLRAVLPTDELLAALDGAEFAILLEELETGGGGFHIRLYAGARELEGLGGAVFQVLLPAPNAAGDLTCTGEDGESVPVRVADGLAVCDLTRTGRYALEADPAVLPAAAPASPETQAVSVPGAVAEGEADMAGGGPAWTAWMFAGVLAVAGGSGGFAVLRLRRRG